MFPPILAPEIDPRVGASLGGLGYAAALSVTGLALGFSFAPGRALLGSSVPAVLPPAVGLALVGGLAVLLARVGLRSPPLVVLVGSAATLYAEVASLRPTIASLLGTWPILAVLTVGIAGIEYGLRRRRTPSIRRSPSTERALLGGGLAASLLLFAFSFRGVGPAAVLFAEGSIAAALGSVPSVFGPPVLLVWASVALSLRYGLLAPLALLPAVGALLATPLGAAFSLFVATSPVLFSAMLVLAAGEYALRMRFSSFRPRSLVG